MEEITIITHLPLERWGEYKQLRVEAVSEVPPAFGRTPEEELKKTDKEWMEVLQNQGNKNWLVFAEYKGVLIGLMRALTDDLEKIRHSAIIISVYVNKKYQGKGVASKLLGALIDEIQKSKTITRLELGVITTQESAIALYKKFGFIIAGTLHNKFRVNGVYYDEYLMEKII